MPRRLWPARRARVLAGLAVLAATALSSAAPALAQDRDDGRVRVSRNWELRPDTSPIYGRDGVGLAVNPRDPDHLVALYADWASLWCETAVSFDGGRTWRRDRLEGPPGIARPTCTVGPHLANQVDGGIAFGRGDDVYATFGSPVADAGGEEDTPHTVLVARSTNGGRSFGKGVVALRAGTDPDQGPYYVFPELAVEPGRRAGRDRIYLIAESTVTDARGAEQEDVVLSVSRDSGRTWSAPRAIDAQGNSIEASRPVLGRRGQLFVAWRTRGAGAGGTPIPEGTVVLA